jgi:TetR/AcrR family transcriptional repressor of nem operon
MRYAPEHKTRTRARILQAAGRLFRRHGYRGVGIDRIMAGAKEALFAAVVDEGTDFVARLREARSSGAAESAEGACAVVSAYLDPANREKVARGCTLATLTQDVARTGPSAKAAYARRIRELAGEIEAHLPAKLPPQVRSERALAAVTLCVGGIAVARSVGDEDLSSEVLRTARERACAALRGSHHSGRWAPPRPASAG